MTDVDAIVLDLDGGPMLQACIDSLAAQTVPPRRILVFDNGSRVPSAPRGKVEILRSDKNLGFAGGANEAVRHATSPLVALINNDVILDRDWLETVLGAMTGRVAAAQTILRRDDHTIDGAGIDLSDGTIRQIGHGLPLGSPLPPAWGVSATAALYRRELLRFDERFFAYYEDVELCARLREEGWGMAVVPLAKATHRGSQSAPVLRGDALRLRTRNRYFVARLHPGTARIGALLREDAKLALRGRTSLRGMIQGLCSPLS